MCRSHGLDMRRGKTCDNRREHEYAKAEEKTQTVRTAGTGIPSLVVRNTANDDFTAIIYERKKKTTQRP